MLLEITLGEQADYSIKCQVLDHPIALQWVLRMAMRRPYPLDDPQRFYQFDSMDKEVQKGLDSINKNIETINSYQQIIARRLESVNDQDTLNYLHHIFEIYHGGLDQQNHRFWNNAPENVRLALAQLNIDVHRCEGLAVMRPDRTRPRFACTWFGLPKTETLDFDLQYQYGELGWSFGGVYLKYTEIGKPCIDLARDNDDYIADEMFKPFTHISADFEVRFHSQTQEQIDEKFDIAKNYFENRRDFFERFDIYSSDDARILPFVFRVAQLIYEPGEEQTIIDNIAKRQYIQDVKFI